MEVFNTICESIQNCLVCYAHEKEHFSFFDITYKCFQTFTVLKIFIWICKLEPSHFYHSFILMERNRVLTKNPAKSTLDIIYKLVSMSLSEITIWSPSKTWFSTWWRNPCSSTFLVVCLSNILHTILAHSSWQTHSESLWEVSWLSLVNSKLQLPPKIFYRVEVWSLNSSRYDLNVFPL